MNTPRTDFVAHESGDIEWNRFPNRFARMKAHAEIMERENAALLEQMKQTISEHMTLAWYDPTNHHVSTDKHDPLFTPLGQLWPLDVRREWVGLTDEEIKDIVGRNDSGGIGAYTREMFKQIEAKLKEKNGG